MEEKILTIESLTDVSYDTDETDKTETYDDSCCLVVVGLPGSGKSYYIKKLCSELRERNTYTDIIVYEDNIDEFNGCNNTDKLYIFTTSLFCNKIILKTHLNKLHKIFNHIHIRYYKKDMELCMSRAIMTANNYKQSSVYDGPKAHRGAFDPSADKEKMSMSELQLWLESYLRYIYFLSSIYDDTIEYIESSDQNYVGVIQVD